MVVVEEKGFARCARTSLGVREQSMTEDERRTLILRRRQNISERSDPGEFEGVSPLNE